MKEGGVIHHHHHYQPLKPAFLSGFIDSPIATVPSFQLSSCDTWSSIFCFVEEVTLT